nr:Trk system potassium transporter TrkA [Desulfogranum marinum]
MIVRILICGATEVGYMIAAQLSLDHDITVIDESPHLPEKFRSLDIRHIAGNGSDIATLEKANQPKADLFIACSTIDEANIVACWTIKKITSIETVCFVSKGEIHHNLISPDQYSYQTKYDIDTVIWPEKLLTEDIFRIILVPEAIDVEYFINGRAKLFEYRIKKDSPLCDTRILDNVFPKDILIVGITRDEVLFIPKGTTKIQLDDKVIFMGTGRALDMLAADLFQIKNKIATAAVIGGGNVGFFLAQQMEQAGIRVKIIEQDQQRCIFLADNLKGSLVLHGDGTDLELLEEESVGAMDVVVCVTNNDEKNLLCSLLVKQLGAQRVVTRVSNSRKAQLFERVGIDVVVSPRESAMKELLNHMQAKDVNILAMVGGGKGEVLRIKVAETFPDTKIMDIGLPTGAIIGVIKRGKGIIIPNGSTVVQAHDRLKIFTVPENTEPIQNIFSR